MRSIISQASNKPLEFEVTAEDARIAWLAVLAALAHMAGQFALAYWVLIPHPGLLRLLPVLMTVALLFGFSGGIIARAMVGGMNGGRAKA
jgi:hypothetical protein